MASKISPPTLSTSSHTKRAPKIPNDEWDIWRPKLEQLFIEDGTSRKDIVDIMMRSHGFNITYEGQIAIGLQSENFAEGD